MVYVWCLASTAVDEPVRAVESGESPQTTRSKSEDRIVTENALQIVSERGQDQTEVKEGQKEKGVYGPVTELAIEGVQGNHFPESPFVAGNLPRVSATDTADDLEAENEKINNAGANSEAATDIDSNPGSESDSSSGSGSEVDYDAESDSDIHSQPISLTESGPYPPTTGQPHVSCIQEAQLSPDGTCIFTSDYERNFSAYLLPSALWNETEPQPLKPYAQSRRGDPIWAFTASPNFDANDPESCIVLISRRDQYIGLHNTAWDGSLQSDRIDQIGQQEPADISQTLASYKLVDEMTEAILSPSCLAFSNSGAYFYAGGKNRIDVFDLTYTDNPIQTIPTIPSVRTKMKDGGRGFKGHISALSISPSTTFHREGIVAAGSRNRFVGLYDAESGSAVTSFSLPTESSFSKNEPGEYCGNGITQLRWSPDGNYLYIAERGSDAMLIYDHRNFSMALGYCAGRGAITQQKLGIDIWSENESLKSIIASHEVWAGGTDGQIRIWQDPHLKEGRIEADDVVRVSNGPVVSPLVHRCGYVAAVASAALERPRDLGDNEIKHDASAQMRRNVQASVFTRKRCNWGRLDIFGLR